LPHVMQIIVTIPRGPLSLAMMCSPG